MMAKPKPDSAPGDLLQPVRRAILGAVPAIAKAKDQASLDEAIRGMFRAAYSATADAFLAAGMCRDRLEHERALRFAIPISAAIHSQGAILAESLVGYDAGQRIARVLEIFRHRVDPSFPIVDFVSDDDLTELLAGIEADWIELAVARTLEPPAEALQPNGSAVAAAREARLSLYLERHRIRGVSISYAATCRAARVDRNTFRDWRRGLLGDESVMAWRIEAVLAN